MTFNEFLGDRIRQILLKKMFGGLCFMIDNKMCIGIIRNEIMVQLALDFNPFAKESKKRKK